MGELIDLNPKSALADADIPGSIARDTEFGAADLAHANAVDPHGQYLPKNPIGIEFASQPGGVNYLDFHTHENFKDFDVRLRASGGGASNGLGFLLLQAALFQVNANFSINGSTQISKLLSTAVSIDMPLIAAGAIGQINQNISGAVVGDLVLFIPLAMSANLPFFNIQSVISATGVATIYFHNLSSTAVDLPAFSGRLLVLGFA